MIDIIEKQFSRDILNIAYRFKNLKYLVADKYGNFFNLSHCINKRTQPFKILKIIECRRIYYNRTAYSLSTLRKIVIKVNEKYNI